MRVYIESLIDRISEELDLYLTTEQREQMYYIIVGFLQEQGFIEYGN